MERCQKYGDGLVLVQVDIAAVAFKIEAGIQVAMAAIAFETTDRFTLK